jgi:hypothetical protein
VIAYRATLDVPRELAQFVAELLLAERGRRGTPRGSRALTCFWQAVLGLRWFRDRTAADALARDHGISRATAYRYLDEVIADQAPDLREALERAKDEGLGHVILDGKIIPTDRCREKTISARGEVIDLWYSGKANTHGGNIQAVLAPGGFPLWVSDVEPGSVHDLTAARAHAFPALYRAPAVGLPALADPGYDGAGIGGMSEHFPARISAVSREASSAFGRTEVIKDALGVVRFPGFAGLAGGVVLVEADEQIGQLTADGLRAQQRGQLGKVDQPVGVPAGPVVVGAVDNPEHAMVGLASLVEQSADLIGSACHLLPLRWRTRPVASRSSACHAYRPKTSTFTHIGGLPESGPRHDIALVARRASWLQPGLVHCDTLSSVTDQPAGAVIRAPQCG